MLRALAAVALEAASAGGHRRPDGCPTCALGARRPATSATARSGEPSAGGLYDDALVRHLRGRPGALHALDSRSAGEVVPVPRWCAPADESDTPAPPRLLRRLGPVPCSAPGPNVGSGLWRDAALLAERGVAWQCSASTFPDPRHPDPRCRRADPAHQRAAAAARHLSRWSAVLLVTATSA